MTTINDQDGQHLELDPEDLRAIDEWIDQAYPEETEPAPAASRPGALARLSALVRRGWFWQMARTHMSTGWITDPLMRAGEERLLWSKRLDYLAARRRFAARARAASRRALAFEKWRYGGNFIEGIIPVAVAIVFMFSTTIYACAQGDRDPLTQPTFRQYGDSDRPEGGKAGYAGRASRGRSKHIAYSDDTFTITLKGCEENEKKHWSCSYTTPDGETHWMYIPNYKPKHQTTEKGGG